MEPKTLQERVEELERRTNQQQNDLDWVMEKVPVEVEKDHSLAGKIAKSIGYSAAIIISLFAIISLAGIGLLILKIIFLTMTT